VPMPQSVRIQRPRLNALACTRSPLQYVLVPAYVRAPQTTRFIKMRTRSLEQFASLPKEAFAAVAADATSIRIDRIEVANQQ